MEQKKAMKTPSLWLLPALVAGVLMGAPATFARAQTFDRYHQPGDFEGAVDQEGARQAVKRGDAAPFTQILPRVRPQIKGEIIGQKLEQHQGVWLYEFRVIGPTGHMRYLHFDARTGKLHQVRPIP